MRTALLASSRALAHAPLGGRRCRAPARARAPPVVAAHRAMHAAPDGSGETLNASLRAGRAALAGTGPLTLVLGNEAADMDSIACAVAFAALLRAGGDEGAVVVVGVPRADLRLRAEVAWLLERERVDVEAMLFSDDAELGAIKAAGRLHRTVLVGAFTRRCRGTLEAKLLAFRPRLSRRPQPSFWGGRERGGQHGNADRGPPCRRRDVHKRTAGHPARGLMCYARGAWLRMLSSMC